MSNYKDIVGTAVRNNAGNLPSPESGQIWFDSTNIDFKYLFPNVRTSWRTGNNMNTARIDLMGAGIQTSALGFGGESSTGNVAITESYNGTSWTEVNDLNTAGAQGGSSGATNTAALCFGRAPATANTENWNGSSWT